MPKGCRIFAIEIAKILTLGILKTSFSLHSLNRIFASEIARIKTILLLPPPNNAPFLLQIGQNTLTLTLGRRGVNVDEDEDDDYL